MGAGLDVYSGDDAELSRAASSARRPLDLVAGRGTLGADLVARGLDGEEATEAA